ncbi:hypothetical protein Goarm_009701 [Gossypium armourianum]|uniref:Uncharacterized protein n=1 Tax=Gossypium armourianum TaxID=34283 RepID=A0A7J9JTS1_9ROSI|nr:hypothetical protein [Gossypium armourianum]
MPATGNPLLISPIQSHPLFLLPNPPLLPSKPKSNLRALRILNPFLATPIPALSAPLSLLPLTPPKI